jgi:hypothetical protein
MSFNYNGSSVKNITNPYVSPPLILNPFKNIHINQKTQKSIVQNSVKTIVPHPSDSSRLYTPSDLAGVNTSNPKLPDNMIVDKNPLSLHPQRPFFVQTGL